MCLAACPRTKGNDIEKNKGKSLTLHMATEQCYFEKDKHETLSYYTIKYDTQWKAQINFYKQGDFNTDCVYLRLEERQLDGSRLRG